MRRSEIELKKGSILRKELLDDIYSYPRIAVNTYFSRFSDGILYGLEWRCSKENKGHHVIMPGAVKFHGEVYFLAESIEVEELLKAQLQIDNKYYLCFEETKKYQPIETQTIYELKLRAVQSEEFNRIKGKSFYYARVRCNEEAGLETFYDGEIYGLYAGEDGFEYKLPNWIAEQMICPIIEAKNEKHLLDYLLLKEIYAKKGLSVSLVNLYLQECGVKLKESDYSSPNILLERLKSAIKELKAGPIIKSSSEVSDEAMNYEEQNGGLLL